MAWSRHNKGLPSIDDETDSTADSDIARLFDSSDDDETDIISNSDTDSSLEINDDIDDNISLFDDEV
jgi:hypothetical protein